MSLWYCLLAGVLLDFTSSNLLERGKELQHFPKKSHWSPPSGWLTHKGIYERLPSLHSVEGSGHIGGNDDEDDIQDGSGWSLYDGINLDASKLPLPATGMPKHVTKDKGIIIIDPLHRSTSSQHIAQELLSSLEYVAKSPRSQILMRSRTFTKMVDKLCGILPGISDEEFLLRWQALVREVGLTECNQEHPYSSTPSHKSYWEIFEKGWLDHPQNKHTDSSKDKSLPKIFQEILPKIGSKDKLHRVYHDRKQGRKHSQRLPNKDDHKSMNNQPAKPAEPTLIENEPVMSSSTPARKIVKVSTIVTDVPEEQPFKPVRKEAKKIHHEPHEYVALQDGFGASSIKNNGVLFISLICGGIGLFAICCGIIIAVLIRRGRLCCKPRRYEWIKTVSGEVYLPTTDGGVDVRYSLPEDKLPLV